jgi:hypothetical protein
MTDPHVFTKYIKSEVSCIGEPFIPDPVIAIGRSIREADIVEPNLEHHLRDNRVADISYGCCQIANAPHDHQGSFDRYVALGATTRAIPPWNQASHLVNRKVKCHRPDPKRLPTRKYTFVQTLGSVIPDVISLSRNEPTRESNLPSADIQASGSSHETANRKNSHRPPWRNSDLRCLLDRSPMGNGQGLALSYFPACPGRITRETPRSLEEVIWQYFPTNFVHEKPNRNLTKCRNRV